MGIIKSNKSYTFQKRKACFHEQDKIQAILQNDKFFWMKKFNFQ